MSARLFIDREGRLYALAACGYHVVRGPEGEPCPQCEPAAMHLDEVRRHGLTEVRVLPEEA